MPGIIWCDGLAEGVGEGEADGICIPGIISCRGVGDGEAAGLTLVRLRVVGRRGFGRVRRLGSAFGFGFEPAGFVGMTCPSCWGSTLMLIVKTRIKTPIARDWIAKSLDQIIFPPCVH